MDLQLMGKFAMFCNWFFHSSTYYLKLGSNFSKRLDIAFSCFLFSDICGLLVGEE
mgnify:CR=1 FL=1